MNTGKNKTKTKTEYKTGKKERILAEPLETVGSRKCFALKFATEEIKVKNKRPLTASLFSCPTD